jgi:hypothetical protein
MALLSNAPFPGFGWHCSSVGFMRRCFFGQIRLARSHIACVALAGFGNSVWSRPVFRDSHGRFGYTRLKVHRCASGLSRSGFRQVRRGSVRIGILRHLTIRSSRPHVVASATCYALRLHVSAAPPQGGLTQALGPMSSYLNRLVGMIVTAVDQTDGYAGLRFNECTFRSFTKHACTAPLSSLVGTAVRSVTYAPEQELIIHFTSSDSLSVHLASQYYTGPEAFVAQFSDGTCVVQ